MALHVVQSQKVDVLVDAMLAHVQIHNHPMLALQPRHFIVPSHAVEVWLTERLAEKTGISANAQFHHSMRAFQWYVYDRVLKEQNDNVYKANMPPLMMQWRIFNSLKEYIHASHNPLSTDHALYPLIQRIYDSADRLQGLEQQLKKQRMLYWVAENVAKLFSHYMMYRGHCLKGCATDACSHNWLGLWGNQQHLDIAKHISRPSVFESEEERIASEQIVNFKQQQAEELQQWQSWLWQHIFHDDFIKIQQIDHDFWRALSQPDTQQKALAKLPQKLVIFTVLELPPHELNLIRKLAEYTEIFLFHYNPSQEYWADMVDPKWQANVNVRIKNRFIQFMEKQGKTVSDTEIQQYIEKYNGDFNADRRESHHPLLTRFGKQARDHFSLLSVLSSGDEGEWYDYFPEFEPTTLLEKIQADVLNLVEPEAASYPLAAEDDSIQVHVCHSSLRQLEVLKDQLINWLAQDEQRQAGDILVLNPNLNAQESLIRSVFAAPPSQRDLQQQHKDQFKHDLSFDSVYLPIQIAGVSSLDLKNAWRSVTGRICLVRDRFSIDEFTDWLSLDATQTYYALDLNAIERMTVLLTEAGFKRGLNEAHLQQSLAANDQDYRFSFKFALDRLAIGIAVPEHCLVQHTLSFDQVMSRDFELIFKLIQIYQDFEERQHWLTQHESGMGKTVIEWLELLQKDIDTYQKNGVDVLVEASKKVLRVQRMLSLVTHTPEDMANEAQQHDLSQLSLPLEYLLQKISNDLESLLENASTSGGVVTFSQIGAIRPLPYKLIVMLNLDSGVFPRRDQQLAFDLMSLLSPQLGDRLRLEDDQGAFLDALLLAKENVWLFYNGFDVNDGEVRDPSTLLQELMQHLAFIVQDPEQETRHPRQVKLDGIEVPRQLVSLYHLHSLQPFDQTRFSRGDTAVFRDQWYRVAKQMQEETTARTEWFGVYPLLEQELRVVNSQQWIKDVTFPAIAYLKAIGVENLKIDNALQNQEPLILNNLEKYKVRDYLLNDEHANMDLLQATLPVGKTREATWKNGRLEYEQLCEQLTTFIGNEDATQTTQQTLKLNPQLHLMIRVPLNNTEKWCNVVASNASAKRFAEVWLEYLLWIAYLQNDQHSRNCERILICKNEVIWFKGVSSSEAHGYLEKWQAFWYQAQQYPILLPADLVLKFKPKTTQFEIDWDEQALPANMDKVIAAWNNTWGDWVSEGSKEHPDWAFILQDSDAVPLLNNAFTTYSYALYAPLIAARQTVQETEVE